MSESNIEKETSPRCGELPVADAAKTKHKREYKKFNANVDMSLKFQAQGQDLYDKEKVVLETIIIKMPSNSFNVTRMVMEGVVLMAIVLSNGEEKPPDWILCSFHCLFH
ncbi:hypothetical protein V8E55_010505 [Tylopilus felleus]